jgi:MSHA pilin protein MshC
MMRKTNPNEWQSSGGFSVVELVTVLLVAGILTAIAVPQMVSQRRLLRSHAVVRQIATQMRYARQLAMSQRKAFTFQYDDTKKEIVIIGNNASGTAVLLDGAYPNNVGSSVLVRTPLATSGISTTEITYGIPSGLPATALTDGVSKTNLTSSKINITFQPDGSVIDAAGNPASTAMYIYNNRVPANTAAAISVIGASGRVKIWRYTSGVNVYAE